ncbi:MAG TPA: AAA domain-containing protein, partial [Acidimicrobiales bacterium]|nr:AAA domain-containing protein [Acidimicrobiales bacterium]
LTTGDRALLDQIEEYNKFDCVSTRLCRDWLLGNCRHPGDNTGDGDLPQVEWFDPAREALEQAAKEAEQEAKRRTHDLEIVALRNLLVRDVGDDDRPWRELLGYLLEYHRREARREWRDFFNRTKEKSPHELLEDVDCIGGLTLDPGVPSRVEARSRVYTLRFPDQETKLRVGRAVRADTAEELDVLSIDPVAGRLELKVGPSRQPLADGISLIPTKPMLDNTIRESIERYAKAIVSGGADTFSATTSILRRDRPRIAGIDAGESLIAAGKDDTQAVIDVIHRMDRTHLVIQGPPGSGKTYTSAHAIVALLKEGKRIGVAAHTHKAIHNLLASVEQVAAKTGFTFRGVKKSTSDDPETEYVGTNIESKNAPADAVTGRYDLVAGTAWLFARADLTNELDYLFVDEAGQVSLANVVAMGPGAKNIVLVGDQMQLSQPVKGSHPGESGASALEFLMQDHATVPADRGVFLAHTHRMNPKLCRFVSDSFYEGRLEADPSTFGQRLVLGESGGVPSAGLAFIPVDHDENSQKSVEEATRLEAIYRELLGKGWIDQHEEPHTLGTDDILVVSPYNMQVNLLSSILPDGARVGTVDRFQGQEAAVVLISLATSSTEYAPRGLEFLLMPNRLNVAVSRARCLSTVIASPRLLESHCRKIEDMARLNILGRMQRMAGL